MRAIILLVLCLLPLIGAFAQEAAYSRIPLDVNWSFQLGDSVKWINQTDFKQWPTRSRVNYWKDIRNKWITLKQEFRLPKRTQFKPYDSLIFLLGELDDIDRTYLNGKLIGQTGTFRPFSSKWNHTRRYTVACTDTSLRWGGVNTLTLQLYNQGTVGGMLGPEQTILVPMPFCGLKAVWPSFPTITYPGSRPVQAIMLNLSYHGNDTIEGKLVARLWQKAKGAPTQTTITSHRFTPGHTDTIRISFQQLKYGSLWLTLNFVNPAWGVWQDSNMVAYGINSTESWVIEPRQTNGLEDSLKFKPTTTIASTLDGQTLAYTIANTFKQLGNYHYNSSIQIDSVLNRTSATYYQVATLVGGEVSGKELAPFWAYADLITNSDKEGQYQLRPDGGIWSANQIKAEAELAAALLRIYQKGNPTGLLMLSYAQSIAERWAAKIGTDNNQLQPSKFGLTGNLALGSTLLPLAELYNITQNRKWLDQARTIIRNLDGVNSTRFISKMLAHEPIQPMLEEDPINTLMLIEGLYKIAYYAKNPVWQEAGLFAMEDTERYLSFNKSMPSRYRTLAEDLLTHWITAKTDFLNLYKPTFLGYNQNEQAYLLNQDTARLWLAQVDPKSKKNLEQLIQVAYRVVKQH